MRKDMNYSILKELEPNEEIVFGPFLGSLEWEMLRWMGFVRWYSTRFPDKRIIVSTRYDRRELYNEIRAEIDLFKIPDSIICIPEGYSVRNFPKLSYNKLIDDIKIEFPKAYIFDPFNYHIKRNMFSLSQMDFKFNSSKSSINIWNQVCGKFSEGRKCIVIETNCGTSRLNNWGEKRWTELIRLLKNTNKYFIIIVGFNTYARPFVKDKDIVILNDYVSDYFNTSKIGLTMEVIKKSELVISTTPSDVILLSNLMKKRSFFWGDHCEKYSNELNPFLIDVHFLKDRDYNYSPLAAFQKIENLSFGITKEKK